MQKSGVKLSKHQTESEIKQPEIQQKYSRNKQKKVVFFVDVGKHIGISYKIEHKRVNHATILQKIMPNYRSKNGKPLSAYNANKRASSKLFIVPKSLELSSIFVYKRTNCLDIFIYENSEAISVAFYRFLILFVTLCFFYSLPFCVSTDTVPFVYKSNE